MTKNSSFDLNEDTFQKMLQTKEKMGFKDKSWDEWFSNIVGKQNSYSEILENVFERKNYEVYFDDWIKNFRDNLNSIRNGNSAKKLIPKEQYSSAIVIGAGPSLKKNKHLEILADSNFTGAVICCDSVLSKVLEAGITPEKFKNFFVISIDTQSHQKEFFEKPIIKKFSNKIKCILSTTVHSSTHKAIIDSGMEIYWVHTLFDYDKGKTSFNYISGIMSRSNTNEKGFPGIQTGGNVGTSAWVISWNILKCPQVVLIGIDNSYPVENIDGKIDINSVGRVHPILYEHLKGSQSDKNNSKLTERAFPIVHNPDFNCYYIQDPIFLYYSNALNEFIGKTKNIVKTINATGGGAIFGEGVISMEFKKFLNDFY